MGPLGCVAGLDLRARFGKLLTRAEAQSRADGHLRPRRREVGRGSRTAAPRGQVLALLLGVATILGLARVADLWGELRRVMCLVTPERRRRRVRRWCPSSS